MQTNMALTPEQQSILDGSKGETYAKVMKTLVMYGETFGAQKMVPVTSEYGHLVTSFGLGAMKPVYDMMDQLIAAGALPAQKFSVDPKPLDKNIPTTLLQDLVFKFMYSQQDRYDAQLKTMGIINDGAYTCTCYMPELGNLPKKGDILSWAESSAVVYANSVLGARCNRNSAIIELFGSIVGFVPYFGFLTDEGRKATWVIELKTTHRPEAQVLGSAIGMKVMEEVPYIKGLSHWLNDTLDANACAYLKDMGAATASNGAVGLYHVAGLTPEAVEQGENIIAPDAKTYVIDDAELQRVMDGYPLIGAWEKDVHSEPKLAFIGCPHLSAAQLKDWTNKIESALRDAGRVHVAVPTVLTAAPAVREEFMKTPDYLRLKRTGVVLSYICPLMYMNNPLCGKMPVLTNSNKLRTYTAARYMTDERILKAITTGVIKTEGGSAK